MISLMTPRVLVRFWMRPGIDTLEFSMAVATGWEWVVGISETLVEDAKPSWGQYHSRYHAALRLLGRVDGGLP